ncbi:glycosyltransferase family 39 protein [Thermodesulfobacteriota bacterium]
MGPTTHNRLHISLFVLLLACGSFLRLQHLDNTILWQDEAETGIYARQMLTGRLPNAYDAQRDLFLISGALIPIPDTATDTGRIDPRIFGCMVEDFAPDGTMLKHPYGDVFLTAVSFYLFGPSTASARLMFALLGVVSLVLTYKLGSYLYSRNVGLMSMALQAGNVVLITYERQARHYSLGICFLLGALYYGLRALERGRFRDYAGTTLCCMMLIFGSPNTAIVAFAVLACYQTCRLRSLAWLRAPGLLWSLGALCVFTLGYAVYYQPWQSWHTTPVHYPYLQKLIKTGLFQLKLMLDCGFLPAALGLLLLALRRRPPRRYARAAGACLCAYHPAGIHFLFFAVRARHAHHPPLSVHHHSRSAFRACSAAGAQGHPAAPGTRRGCRSAACSAAGAGPAGLSRQPAGPAL